MGKLKGIVVLVSLIGLGFGHVSAQEYKTAVGFRAGLGTGLTVRHALNSAVTVEGIAQFLHSGFEFTGLYEIQNPRAFDVPRLNWYYGFGGHVGFFDENHPRRDAEQSGQFVSLGVDGIIAMEYNFQEAPINISVDWKPTLDLIGGTGFGGDSGALSLRYYF